MMLNVKVKLGKRVTAHCWKLAEVCILPNAL